MCIGIFTEILKATYIDANVANPVSQADEDMGRMMNDGQLSMSSLKQWFW